MCVHFCDLISIASYEICYVNMNKSVCFVFIMISNDGREVEKLSFNTCFLQLIE